MSVSASLPDSIRTSFPSTISKVVTEQLSRLAMTIASLSVALPITALMAIAIDDCDCHDGDKTVERVKCRKRKLVLIDHDDTKSDLNKDGEFSDSGVPPQGTSTQRRDLVCGKCPHTSETVADDCNPGPRTMNVRDKQRNHVYKST